MVDEVRRKHCKSVHLEEERGCERTRKQKGSPTPQSGTNPGEDWEVAPSPFTVEAEWAGCQRCSRMTAEKDGGDGEDSAGTSGKRRQMGGGDFTKVEAAKRGRQKLNEERVKIIEVNLVKWISVEHREEVHEKIHRKM